MSDLTLLRTLIADPIQYDSATAASDGVITEFLYPYAPIQPGTSRVMVNGILTSTGFSIDEDLGLFTFATAPQVGTVVIAAKHTLLSDTQLSELLASYPDSDNPIKLAAADALDSIASSEALIQKKIDMLDLKTDGPALARSLREHAANLRKLVFDKNSVEPSFEVIEQINDAPAYDEFLYKDYLKSI